MTQVGVPLLHQQQMVCATSDIGDVKEGIKSLAKQSLNYSCEEDTLVRPSLLKRAFSPPPTLLNFFKPVISSTAIKTEGGSPKASSPSLLPLSPHSQRGQPSAKHLGRQSSIASFLKVKSPQPQEVVLLDDDSQNEMGVDKPSNETEVHCSDPPGTTSQEVEPMSDDTTKPQEDASIENVSLSVNPLPVSEHREQPSWPPLQQTSQATSPSTSTDAGPCCTAVASPVNSSTSSMDQTPSTPSSGDGDAKEGHGSHLPGCSEEANGVTDPHKSPISAVGSTGSANADECHKGKPLKRKTDHGLFTCARECIHANCSCLKYT